MATPWICQPVNADASRGIAFWGNFPMAWPSATTMGSIASSNSATKIVPKTPADPPVAFWRGSACTLAVVLVRRSSSLGGRTLPGPRLNLLFFQVFGTVYPAGLPCLAALVVSLSPPPPKDLGSGKDTL